MRYWCFMHTAPDASNSKLAVIVTSTGKLLCRTFSTFNNFQENVRITAIPMETCLHALCLQLISGWSVVGCEICQHRGVVTPECVCSHVSTSTPPATLGNNLVVTQQKSTPLNILTVSPRLRQPTTLIVPSVALCARELNCVRTSTRARV